MVRSLLTSPAGATMSLKLQNRHPVELLDLTASLQAFGEQYRDFVYDHGFDPVAENVKLYVSRLETGSIIAEMKAIADQASFVLEHAEVFAAFLTNFNDLMQFFLTMSGESSRRAEPVSRQDAERVAQVMEPVAKDHGSQIFFTVNGARDITINNYHYTSEQAGVVQNNVRRFLGPPVVQSGYFSNEVLALHQVRGDTSRRGDRGVIERFSTKPVKLMFMNDNAKRAIVDREDNPFRLAFIVDGQVSTADGKPALYKIYAVHDALERPD